MNHHAIELLARERIETFRREAANDRLRDASGRAARSSGTLADRLAALFSRLRNVRKPAVAGQLPLARPARTAEAPLRAVEVIPDA